MTNQIGFSVLLILASVAAPLAAQSAPTDRRAASHPSARCFRLDFTRDSSTALLPDRLQWTASDSIARLAWDTTSADARELSRQTRGRARWRRIGKDSVVVVIAFDLVDWAADMHFTLERDSVRGVIDAGRSGSNVTRPFVGAPVACPVHDHAS